jgi:N-acetyl-gamma-glutamyl-phosphate reductase
MIKVAIIGATGYSGRELIRILLNHPSARITYLGGRKTGVAISDIHPSLLGLCDATVRPIDVKKVAAASDVAFLALPHTKAMELAGKLLEAGLRVIDLSADFRLKSPNTYEKWYKVKHTDRTSLRKAVYGLPEIYSTRIRGAQLIANPGCYPTGAILAAAPIITGKMVKKGTIVIDAKSGVSGAGKQLTETTHFAECNEDIQAYKVLCHQHTPEIEQALSKIARKKIGVAFTPHLVPMDRGILSTVYFELVAAVEEERIMGCYETAYRNAPFVRIVKGPKNVRVKNVAFTNFCDIRVYAAGKRLIVISAIDNLVKGASGQAVQNMNLMFDVDQTAGLLGTR